MRAREAIAGLLAALLLASSCVTSACTTRCDLSPRAQLAGLHAHAQIEAEDQRGMRGMAHCSMQRNKSSAKASSYSIEASGVCDHRRCSQHPALLSTREEIAATEMAPCHASVTKLVALQPTLQAPMVLSAAAPLRTTVPIALQNQLRV